METIVKGSEVEVPKAQLLRFNQREEIKQEIDAMKGMLPKLTGDTDRGQVISRLKRQEKTLQDLTPMTPKGPAENKLYARIKQLEEQFVPGMLSKEEMRKNPAGAVGAHMRWERANKKKIMEWKNLKMMQDPSSDDPDIANIEILRPTGVENRFRGDAQINGHMTYQNIDQEKWDMAFEGKGPENTALKQVQKVEAAAKVDKVDKRTLPRTEEQKQALRDRLALARAKQATKQEGDPVSPQEGESVPFEGA